MKIFFPKQRRYFSELEKLFILAGWFLFGANCERAAVIYISRSLGIEILNGNQCRECCEGKDGAGRILSTLHFADSQGTRACESLRDILC